MPDLDSDYIRNNNNNDAITVVYMLPIQYTYILNIYYIDTWSNRRIPTYNNNIIMIIIICHKFLKRYTRLTTNGQ